MLENVSALAAKSTRLSFSGKTDWPSTVRRSSARALAPTRSGATGRYWRPRWVDNQRTRVERARYLRLCAGVRDLLEALSADARFISRAC